jgi:probable HAF family extracellular repeat protein
MSWQNARGQIVGLSYTSDTPDPANNGFPGFDPFLWQNGHMIDLGTLGGTLGAANWINDAGEVVGQSNLAGDQNTHPFLWTHGKMIDLGTPGGSNGFASYINQRGDVVGGAQASDQNFHGFLWHNGKMIDLSPAGGAAQAFGNAVNNRGEVVGNEDDSNFNQIIASLWTAGHGYDLNTLVAPSDFQMISADYIDGRGDIVGHGVFTSGPNNGNARMFLLLRNPSVPLPQTPTPDRRLRTTGLPDQRASAQLAHKAGEHGGLESAGIRQLLLNPRR